MLISEIISPALFLATARPKESSSFITRQTVIHAEGKASRAGVIEQWGTQTLDSDQLRLKSLADQKAQIGQNEKRERARQKMAKAQQAMQKANKPKSPL